MRSGAKAECGLRLRNGFARKQGALDPAFHGVAEHAESLVDGLPRRHAPREFWRLSEITLDVVSPITFR